MAAVGRPLQVMALPAFEYAGNPYVNQLYQEIDALGVKVSEFDPLRVALGSERVWHLHWPDYYLSDPGVARVLFRTSALLALMDLAHARRKKILWTVHNLAAHENLHPRIERRFWPAFIRRVDGTISLTPAGQAAAFRRFPELAAKPGFVIPHGHYRGLYADAITREAARPTLGVDAQAPMVLFFGAIRPYKNVPRLIEAFRRMQHPKAILVVAGKCGSERDASAVRAAGAGDPRIRLHLDFVAPSEVQRFMRAADLVVLPFRDILNSGSALLALSFGRPVLVPEKGAMAELRALAGPDWVMTYEGELTPAVIERGLAWAVHPHRTGAPELPGLEWTQIARSTISAYRALCEARTEHPA